MVDNNVIENGRTQNDLKQFGHGMTPRNVGQGQNMNRGIYFKRHLPYSTAYTELPKKNEPCNCTIRT